MPDLPAGEIVMMVTFYGPIIALLAYDAIITYLNCLVYKKMSKEELYKMCTNDPNITFSYYFPCNTKELHDYVADNIKPFNGSNGFCIEQYFSNYIVKSQD